MIHCDKCGAEGDSLNVVPYTVALIPTVDWHADDDDIGVSCATIDLCTNCRDGFEDSIKTAVAALKVGATKRRKRK